MYITHEKNVQYSILKLKTFKIIYVYLVKKFSSADESKHGKMKTSLRFELMICRPVVTRKIAELTDHLMKFKRTRHKLLIFNFSLIAR